MAAIEDGELKDYIKLIEETGSAFVNGKKGVLINSILLEKLDLSKSKWQSLIESFHNLFKGFVGSVKSMDVSKNFVSQSIFA